MIFSSFVKKVDYAVTHIQDEVLAVTVSPETNKEGQV